MQKIISFTKTVCGNVDDGDARQYENKKAFTIEPGEDLIFILRHCGNSWLRGGLSFAVKKWKNQFMLRNQRPYQLCLWIRNMSSTVGMYVEEDTTLASVLMEPELIFKLCHISWDHLYEIGAFEATAAALQQQESKIKKDVVYLDTDDDDDNDDDDNDNNVSSV